MPRAKVIITDFVPGPPTFELGVLGDLAQVVALDAMVEEDIIGRVEDADAIMMYHQISMTRRSLERLTRCKLIVRCGVGIDNVDHAFARTRGIALVVHRVRSATCFPFTRQRLSRPPLRYPERTPHRG